MLSFFYKNPPVPLAVRAIESYRAISYSCWLLVSELPTVHTNLQRPFIYYIQLLAVAPWTNLESILNGAMNILKPECCFSLYARAEWTLRAIGNSGMMPVNCTDCAMIFISAILLGFEIANQKQRGTLNFRGLSQDRGRTDFSGNLRASLFNDDLSNESHIHLAGQYL